LYEVQGEFQRKRGCPGVQGEFQRKRGCPGVQGEFRKEERVPWGCKVNSEGREGALGCKVNSEGREAPLGRKWMGMRIEFGFWRERLLVREGRIVVQGMSGEYLLRVFVDIDRHPPEVVTSYRTSNVGMYRRSL